MVMNRDDFLKKADLKFKEITVPVWGKVYIRQVSAFERAQMNEQTLSMQDSDKDTDQIRMMAIACTYFMSDDTGVRLLQEGDEEDLLKKAQEPVEAVFFAGMKYASMGEKAISKAKKKSR